jgi:hypothetical protein
MSSLEIPSSQQVAFVKNYEELAQVTTWKSYAVKAGSVLLALSLINDIYKKRVAQGVAHMWCLGVNWILHNAIYVKDLEDLVPVLGATAQRYSEEIEELSKQVSRLEANLKEQERISKEQASLNKEHEELLSVDKQNLVEKRAQLKALESSITILRLAHDQHKEELQRVLAEHFTNPRLILETALKRIPSSNQTARDLTGQAIQALI